VDNAQKLKLLEEELFLMQKEVFQFMVSSATFNDSFYFGKNYEREKVRRVG